MVGDVFLSAAQTTLFITQMYCCYFPKKKIQLYIERFIWTVAVIIISSVNTNASSCGADINNVLAEVVY